MLDANLVTVNETPFRLGEENAFLGADEKICEDGKERKVDLVIFRQTFEEELHIL